MTEDEAKTKWCPFARTVAVVSRDTAACASANRDGSEHYGVGHECNCIASACAVWQQTDNEAKPYPPGEPSPFPKPAGYCGLMRTSP